MTGVPFDPSLMGRFIAAAETSTARMEQGTMTDWLAIRWGVDADGLVVYSGHYAELAVASSDIDARPVALVRNGFVGGFTIALELVSRREAAKS